VGTADLPQKADPPGQRSALPSRADIVAKRFLVLERRTVFSRLDRIGNFDSQNRPFRFYYCRISLAGPFLGDFCNNIGQNRTHALQHETFLFDHFEVRPSSENVKLNALAAA
jgi:hypothetical protein